MSFYGTFIRFLWRNEKTGNSKFTVKKDESTVYTCEGVIQKYPVGIPLKIEGQENKNGEWINITCTSVKAFGFDYNPMLNFLCGREFREIGQITSTKLLDNLGNDLFSYYGNKLDLSYLSNKTSIKYETLSKVFKSLNQYTGFELLYEKLLSYDCNYFNAKKIYEIYGNDSLSVIHNNPYVLLYADATLDSCEKIAQSYGIQSCDTKRTRAVVENTMILNRKNGNTKITFRELCKRIKKDEEKTDLGYLTEPLFIAEEILENKYIIKNRKSDIDVYLKEDYESEKQIADNLYRLQTAAVELNDNVSISEIEKICNVKYSPEQKNAFQVLKNTGVKIITGGPGTGKTTLLNGILKKYEQDNPGKIIQLCAPTGCAARRMQESTKRDAYTIHKLLNIQPYETLGVKKREKLPADCLVIDEGSMPDAYIMANLLLAVKNEALILILGDKDQLPSIGAGNVFEDILTSEKFEVYHLTTIFRQNNRNLIIDNSRKVISGITHLETDKHFVIRRFKTEDEMVEDAVKTAKVCFSTKYNTKLYTPSRKPKFKSGSINLNRLIRNEKVNNETDSIDFGYYTYSIGDRVMFNTNNYEKGYFNGQEGVISHIQKHTGTTYITITTEGDSITLSGMDIDDIELDYASTAHKSQGGECDNAIIMIPQKPASLLKRKVLYVEITRARKNVCILSENDALEKTISNYMEKPRETGLKEMLMCHS